MSRFNDFDEDDPLAGLLSDDEEEKPIRKTLASLSTTEISKNTSKGLIEVKKEADGIMKQDSMPSFSEPVQQYKAPSSAFMDSLFGRTSEKTESKSLRGIFDTNDQELEKPKFAITKTLETEKRNY
ncbi:FBF1 [Lepeophtheirus salmonis]|uniref:FBF1 n=1 Tax=Lepeophtheirus salmonis TaxID=72036 RepID=A0A7R8CV95_LEPSM|nr:FBF1 [Lepeophtheirus salmonis]CAF2892135.1 FBF1 [Lepeophtheirus salmonis]